MKLCPAHRNQLRTALARHLLDVRDQVGPTNPLFQAEGLLYANIIQQFPQSLDAPPYICPFCTRGVPEEWLVLSAASIAEEVRKNSRAQ